MTRPVRTRFAPSPSGSLHVGNLRTAVFNHLFARGHGGVFILRIEDTDAERNVPGAVEGILHDLRWAGLEWDEGPEVGGDAGPYHQSGRGALHRERATELLERGWAYRCVCVEEPGGGRREGRRGVGCPGGCRDLSSEATARWEAEGRPFALRFAVPDAPVTVHDVVRGEITVQGADVGDFVIQRSDGRATYNFAVVADDIAMGITHVIRGAGHLSNTPKQALLFDALEAPRPVFAHLPTVLAPEGGKLSKRTGAPGIRELEQEGYHPDGVVNYLSLLGWSPGGDREVLSREELAEGLDLEGVGASDTMYDPEKLRWMSAQHIARMSPESLRAAVAPHLDGGRFPLDDRGLSEALEAIRTRLHTFGEVNDHLSLIFADPAALAAGREELRGEGEGAFAVLRAVVSRLSSIEPWEAGAIAGELRGVGQALGIRGAPLFHPVRLALTGTRSGPDLGMVMAALGRQGTIERLGAAALPFGLTTEGDLP